MLDPQTLRKIRYLRLWAHQKARGELRGHYRSTYSGSGLEFDDYRRYVWGDEVKHIDWKVTARQNQTHVRVYREERDVVFHLILDVSSSMFFGSKKGRRKIDAAAELVALISALVDLNGDRCSLTLFSHHIVSRLPARRGPGHIHRMLGEIASLPRYDQKTSLASVLRTLRGVFRRGCLVMVISDFLDETAYADELKILSRAHGVSGIRILDPTELSPPASSRWLAGSFTGLGLWRDVESATFGAGRLLGLDGLGLDGTDRRSPATQPWPRMIRRCGVRPVVMTSHDDPVMTLKALSTKDPV